MRGFWRSGETAFGYECGAHSVVVTRSINSISHTIEGMGKSGAKKCVDIQRTVDQFIAGNSTRHRLLRVSMYLRKAYYKMPREGVVLHEKVGSDRSI